MGADLEKSLVHIAISPAARLKRDQEIRLLAEVRRAYEISSEQPILVVAHDKPGDKERPPHLHAVFPRRDVVSGHLIRDSFYRQKNDRLAVQLDAEFSAPTIVPILHQASVERWLTTHEPEALEKIRFNGGLKKPTNRSESVTAAEKRRASDEGMDIIEFRDRALFVFDAIARKRKADEADWLAAGLRLARGDKAVMVVDVISGHSAALSRALNAAAKKRGDRRRWSDGDLASLASDAASLSAVLAGIKTLGVRETVIGKVGRGRHPRASSDEIATEMARIKAAAAQARQQARSLDRRLRRPDRTARRLAIAALFATGNPQFAIAIWGIVAVYRLAHRQRLRSLRDRLRRDGDAKAQVSAYIASVRAANASRSRPIARGRSSGYER